MNKDPSEESLACCQMSRNTAWPDDRDTDNPIRERRLNFRLRPGLLCLAFYEMPPGDNESRIPLHMGFVNTEYPKY